MTDQAIHLEGNDLLAQGSIRSTVRRIYGQVRPTDRRVAERNSVPLTPPALRERVERLLIASEPEGEVAK